jgi:hypothetical protein
MNHAPIFMPFDKVSYTGTRFAKELHGDLGIVLTRVQNQPSHYVVDFSKESYVLHESYLMPFQQSPDKKKHTGPEVEPRRKRAKSEEE